MVRFNRNGTSGNIFAIMGMARRVLTLEGRKPDADMMCTRVMQCASYDDALEVIAEYVDLVEDEE